jgi:hypothetical protein
LKITDHNTVIEIVRPQATILPGKYSLENISLIDIDVVHKGIANRKFFWWDPKIDHSIEWIKNNFEKLPPVILEEFEDHYYSVDGHHRITAALELGKVNILAYTIKVKRLSYERSR